jgi:hypothetical protein
VSNSIGRDAKSLYHIPTKVAKKPISRSRYRIGIKFLKTVLEKPSGTAHKKQAKINKINPWAMSPNITAKRNGKVTVATTDGLNSL